MMKVKVQYGNDIRLWRYPTEKKYQNLLSFIVKTFNFLHGGEFYVQFEDEEGDRLTIASETDFEDAFSCCEQEERKSLKIFVVKGSIEDSHRNIANSFVGIGSPSVISSNQSVLQEEKKLEEKLEEKRESTQEQSSNQNGNCFQWRQLVVDFLQNKEIDLLLPQLVRRIVVEVRKQNSPNNHNNNNDKPSEKSLLNILNEVLKEDKFQPIVKHELFQKKIKSMLPCIAQRIEMYQHVLLAFNEDAIASWVPQLIGILKHSIRNFENIDVSLDVDPMLHQFMGSNFCSFNSGNEMNHYGITCDMCNQHPIKGVRYKCSVCPNYDLCSKCESNGKHHPSHPLVKFFHPAAFSSHSFCGLRELMKHHRFSRCGMKSFCKLNSNQSCHEKWGNNCSKRGSKIQCKMEKMQRKLAHLKEKQQKITNLENSTSDSGSSSNSNDGKNEKNEVDIRCKCGKSLVKIFGRKAYHGSNVNCDLCGKKCSNSFIYHCPDKRSLVHSGGYDLCLDCAKIQIDSISNATSNLNDNDNLILFSDIIVNQSDIANSDVKDQKQVQTEIVMQNNEDTNKKEKQNENQEIFQFEEALNHLNQMGFYDNETIKTLLIKHNGQVDPVIQDLFKNSN